MLNALESVGLRAGGDSFQRFISGCALSPAPFAQVRKMAFKQGDQGLGDQRTFAAARDTRDADQDPQREAHSQVAEVVGFGVVQGEMRALLGDGGIGLWRFERQGAPALIWPVA